MSLRLSLLEIVEGGREKEVEAANHTISHASPRMWAAQQPPTRTEELSSLELFSAWRTQTPRRKERMWPEPLAVN